MLRCASTNCHWRGTTKREQDWLWLQRRTSFCTKPKIGPSSSSRFALPAQRLFDLLLTDPLQEFYTPLPAKSVSFALQSDSSSTRSRSTRGGSNEFHVRELGRLNSEGPGFLHRPRNVDYGVQPCLFVAFEKKAVSVSLGICASLSNYFCTGADPTRRRRGHGGRIIPRYRCNDRHVVFPITGLSELRNHVTHRYFCPASPRRLARCEQSLAQSSAMATFGRAPATTTHAGFSFELVR